MNWDDLRYFLALARHHTLSAAAARLQVKHTTVARRVRALEEACGVSLVEPGARGYTLTDAGAEMLAYATTIEEQFLALDRSVLGRDASLSGTLRVTSFDIALDLYAPAIAEFTRRYPEVELELTVQYDVRNLTKREADVAIRMTASPPEHLVGRRVTVWPYALYGATSLIERVGRDQPLAAYPWLAWDPRRGAVMTEQWMRKHVPGARVSCRVDTATAMVSGVREGVGVTFLPVPQAERTPGIEPLTEPVPELAGSIWMLIHPDLRSTARVRAFVDHMRDAF